MRAIFLTSRYLKCSYLEKDGFPRFCDIIHLRNLLPRKDLFYLKNIGG